MPFRTRVFIYFRVVNEQVSHVTCIKKYLQKNGKKHGDNAQISGAMYLMDYGNGTHNILPELLKIRLHIMQGTALQNLYSVSLLAPVLKMLLRLSIY